MPRARRRGSAPVPASRSLSWWAPALAVAFASFFLSQPAQAYPWMVRHGYTNCSGCHADPSGGELLTLYGHVISYEVLSTRWGGSPGTSSEESESESDSEESDSEARRWVLKRRTARAVAHAAGAKSANPEEEEEDADAEAADGESGDEEGGAEPGEEAASEEGDGASEGNGEGEGADDGGEAAAASEAPAAEPSPFDGLGALTGPLLGIGPASESLLLGGSVRLASIYKLSTKKGEDKFSFFPMQLDLYGQLRIGSALRAGASLGAVKVPAGSPHGRAAQVTTNQGDGYNLISRTHWVGFDFGEGQHTVRAGRLNLPFGIRMSEHVMWVRERTQTDRESDQQHGVSLYMGFEGVRFELMAILGNYQINGDVFRERGYSGYLEIAPSPTLAVGASSLYTYAKDDRLEPAGLATMRQAHGPFVRWAPAETVSIMAEADVLIRSRRDMGYVGYLQVDVEPIQGIHFIGTGELLDGGYPERSKRDADPRTAGLGRPLPGGWLSLQWFFLPHFDLRVDAIIRQEKQLMSQLHIYL